MPQYLITAKLESKKIDVTRYRGEEIESISEEDEVTVRFVLNAKTIEDAKQSAPYATKRVVDAIIEERKKKNQESDTHE